MIQRGKAWYELSLVSPTIETILETNEALEVGERTEEWCSVDYLGILNCLQGRSLSLTKEVL
jgi:hypothetical protein